MNTSPQMLGLNSLYTGVAYCNRKQELAKGLFPDGLVFSREKKFFEPQNVPLTEMASRFLESLEAGETSISPIGAGDGI